MSDGRHTVDLLDRILALTREQAAEVFVLASRVVQAHIRVRRFQFDPDDAAGVAVAIVLPLLPLAPTASLATREHVEYEQQRIRRRIARRRRTRPEEPVDSPAELRTFLAKLLLSDADRELQRLRAWHERVVGGETLLSTRVAPDAGLDWLLRLRASTEIPLSPALRAALTAMITHEGDYAAAAAELGIRQDALRRRLCTLRTLILAQETCR